MTDSKRVTREACPVCGDDDVSRLPDDWQSQVEDGAAIPIIGCGNPWHYANLDRPPDPPASADVDAARYEMWDGSILAISVGGEDPGDIGEPRDVYADGVTYLSVKAALNADPPVSADVDEAREALQAAIVTDATARQVVDAIDAFEAAIRAEGPDETEENRCSPYYEKGWKAGRAAALDEAWAAVSARYDGLRWCNKEDNCHDLAGGAELALSDIDALREGAK